MKDTPTTIRPAIERLKEFEWFANCGKPFPYELNIKLDMLTKQVRTWKQAQKHYRDANWFNVRSTLSGGIRSYLRYKGETAKAAEFELINDEVLATLNAEIKPLIEKVQIEKGLDEAFVRGVLWDLHQGTLDVLYEEETSVTFFRQLLWIYEAGHFPCGWRGHYKKYPSGDLLVL